MKYEYKTIISYDGKSYKQLQQSRLPEGFREQFLHRSTSRCRTDQYPSLLMQIRTVHLSSSMGSILSSSADRHLLAKGLRTIEVGITSYARQLLRHNMRGATIPSGSSLATCGNINTSRTHPISCDGNQSPLLETSRPTLLKELCLS